MKKLIVFAILMQTMLAGLFAAQYVSGIPVEALRQGLSNADLNSSVRALEALGYGILHYDEDWVLALAPDPAPRSFAGELHLAEFPPVHPLYLAGKTPGLQAPRNSAGVKLLLELRSAWLLESSLPEPELRALITGPLLQLDLRPMLLRDSSASQPLLRNTRTDIAQIIAGVDADSVLACLQGLQDLQTRYARADNRLAVAQWIQQKFLSYGVSDTQLQSFNWTYSSVVYDQYNVVATIPGTLYPDQYILIGGHHDSTSSGDPFTLAPGADDNASGTVAALEMARVIMQSGYQPPVSLRFVTYAAEEFGLIGSAYSALADYNAGLDIRLMINHDMIANNTHDPSSWQVRLMPYDGCQDYSAFALDVTEEFTSLDAYYGALNSAQSDSWSYWQKGYPVLYFFEADFSTYYHSPNDLVANTDPAYCAEVIRASLACAVAFTELDQAPALPEALEGTEVTAHGFTANWEPLPDAVAYYLDVYTVQPGGPASGLFFSEYAEGYGNNHALEIFNGTGNAVDLSDYRVEYYAGAATAPTASLNLSGSLPQGQTLVIAHPSANVNFLDRADILSTLAVFDGDDQLALRKLSTNGFADIIGRIGTDPGTAWGTAPLTTRDRTLVRKSTVTDGVTANPASGFPTLDTEWNSYDRDVYRFLGRHSLDLISYVDGYQNYPVGTLTSCSVPGLKPETTYYYVVRADLGYGTFGESAAMAVTTLTDQWLPVELVSFNAAISAQNNVILSWRTESETGMSGYRVYRSATSLPAEAALVSALIPAQNLSQQQDYSFTDGELFASGTYWYWLDCIDLDGSGLLRGPVSVYYDPAGNYAEAEVPRLTALHSPYPNPFNPSLCIPFSISADKGPQPVRLQVCNLRGQQVYAQDLGLRQPGTYQDCYWTGQDSSGNELASGVYLIRLQAGNAIFQRKAVLVK